MEAFRFKTEVVYTNVVSAGAYRGYGATQGIFAVESAVNELAHELNMDPVKIREMNMVKEGDVLTNYFGEVTKSCNLDKCVAKVKEMIGAQNIKMIAGDIRLKKAIDFIYDNAVKK